MPPKPTYPAQTRHCAHFRKACQLAGIHTPPNCGPAVRDVLLSLRASPLLLNTGRNKDYHRATPTNQPLVGMAIKTGFARFVADEKCYVITPAGETWLNELEIHGLLEGKAESGNVKAEMKARTSKQELDYARTRLAHFQNLESFSFTTHTQKFARLKIGFYQARIAELEAAVQAEEKGARP